MVFFSKRFIRLAPNESPFKRDESFRIPRRVLNERKRPRGDFNASKARPTLIHMRWPLVCNSYDDRRTNRMQMRRLEFHTRFGRLERFVSFFFCWVAWKKEKNEALFKSQSGSNLFSVFLFASLSIVGNISFMITLRTLRSHGGPYP